MQPDTVVSPVRCIARQGTESQTPLNWDWVEASVWTERMLAALGNGVKGGKWFSLIDINYAGQMHSSRNEGFSPCMKPG